MQDLTVTAIQDRILRYATLKRELKFQNSQKKLTAITIIVTQPQGKMRISLQEITDHNSLISPIDEFPIIEVSNYSLDEYLKDLPPKIDIINLDTKWLPALIFEGMENFFKINPHAKIFIEFRYSDFDEGEAIDFIYQILKSGFSIAKINQDQTLSVISEHELMSMVSVKLVLKKVIHGNKNPKNISDIKQHITESEVTKLSNSQNDTSKQINSNQSQSLSQQSGTEADVIEPGEKYTLNLRLSGIVEDISRNSKPKVIEKLETLHHRYDNAGFIDWEKVLELGYRLFLNSNSTVIDIGGHAGRHSDIFINQIGCKEVYIFEPIPSKYQHLVNRYSSNSNVTVKHMALSSSVGESEFLINHGAPEESGLKERIYNNPELKNIEKIVVAINTLDNIFIDFPAVEYIKIDTEGGEIDILRGAVSLLQKFRPLISVEYGKPSYSAYGHNQETLFLYCQKQGYVITDLFGNPIESIDIWRECVDSFYWDYYLVPQEKLSFFASILTGLKEKEAIRNNTKLELNGNDKPCNSDQILEKKDNDQANKSFDYHKYPPRLNLGCGYDIRSGYLNVDFQEKHNPDLLADIRLLDILPSGYYEEIVAQDCLEHFERTDTELALKEWHRLLKIGGLLKLRVPDIASAVAILNSNTDINHQKGWIQMIFGTQAYTGDYHFTSFTDTLVRHYLEETGFKVNELKLFDRWLLDIVAEKIN